MSLVKAKGCPPPWRSQYDNVTVDKAGRAEGPGSCNMTSAWMVIEHYFPGKVKDPDVLLRLCDKNGWDRHKLEVIDRVLEMHGVSDISSYTHTLEDVKKHIQGGDLTIIQGEYTPSGHIIVVWGFDPDKGLWYCNDPAGRFDLDNGRYNGWVSGQSVTYPSSWFRPKSAPDGYCWAHLCSKGK